MIGVVAALCFASGLVGAVHHAGAASIVATPLVLGVTTSTENSGLLAHLLDKFEDRHGIEVRAVTAGSGAVLGLAERGDVDVILVHAPDDEAVLVEKGYGADRRTVMYNRFVVVGPETDPAGIRIKASAADAFRAIAESGALFLSRGDESGTHRAEQRLWQAAGVTVDREESSTWYRESGAGQGATLNIAANTGAYVLTDEATWATFGNRGELDLLYDGSEAAMNNIYSVIRVDPKRHPGINVDGARLFADWLTSKAGRAAISSFRFDGRLLFWPEGEAAG
jgi:tungstate transport system substrate-binding protein